MSRHGNLLDYWLKQRLFLEFESCFEDVEACRSYCMGVKKGWMLDSIRPYRAIINKMNIGTVLRVMLGEFPSDWVECMMCFSKCIESTFSECIETSLN